MCKKSRHCNEPNTMEEIKYELKKKKTKIDI